MLQARNLTKANRIHNVSLTIQAGESLALMGPSGCGKTTLARCLARRELPDSGEVIFPYPHTSVQLIPQDPADSLQPRFSVLDLIAEPFVIQRDPAAQTLARERMTWVGLPENLATRRPHQLSGGQRARVAIARALMLPLKLLILDESLASLNQSLQTEIVALLQRLQSESGMAILYITHSPELAAQAAPRRFTMESGRLISA